MSDDLAHKDCRVACQEQDSDCGAKNTVQKEGRESESGPPLWQTKKRRAGN